MAAEARASLERRGTRSVGLGVADHGAAHAESVEGFEHRARSYGQAVIRHEDEPNVTTSARGDAAGRGGRRVLQRGSGRPARHWIAVVGLAARDAAQSSGHGPIVSPCAKCAGSAFAFTLIVTVGLVADPV